MKNGLCAVHSHSLLVRRVHCTTCLIRDHSFGASSSTHNSEHLQNCAWNSTHKWTCQKDARHAQGAMDQRSIHAEHSVDIRCMFIALDVANTHGDVELSPYLWCNWWQARQLQVSFKQQFHILGPITTVTKGSAPLSCRCWLQVYLSRHRRYEISMKCSDLQCFFWVN